MAQGIKALWAKADNLRSILGSNVVEKEPTSLFSFDHHTWVMTHAHKIKWIGTAEITQHSGYPGLGWGQVFYQTSTWL